MTKKVLKQLIKEFLKEVYFDFDLKGDTLQGAKDMKNISNQPKPSLEQNEQFDKAFEQGRIDAVKGAKRDENPFKKTGNSFLIQGWWDGWDVQNKRYLKEDEDNDWDRDTFQGMLSMKKLHKDILIRDLDTFTDAYIVMALYTSTDESTPSGGHPLDKNYTMNHFTLETLEKMVKDCKDFQEKYGRVYELAGIDDEEAGKCFWLNRNGHGTGFQDIFDYRDPLDKQMQASELRRAAQSYGSYDLYLIDNGPEEGMIAGHPNK